MRIKKDDSSWHASGIKTRDARHDRSSPEVAGHRAKKDCKRWCRGKVGREHEGEWKSLNEVRGFWSGRNSKLANTSQVFVCKRCGRHLDYCWSWFGGRCKNKTHPHHVTKK